MGCLMREHKMKLADSRPTLHFSPAAGMLVILLCIFCRSLVAEQLNSEYVKSDVIDLVNENIQGPWSKFKPLLMSPDDPLPNQISTLAKWELDPVNAELLEASKFIYENRDLSGWKDSQIAIAKYNLAVGNLVSTYRQYCKAVLKHISTVNSIEIKRKSQLMKCYNDLYYTLPQSIVKRFPYQHFSQESDIDEIRFEYESILTFYTESNRASIGYKLVKLMEIFPHGNNFGLYCNRFYASLPVIYTASGFVTMFVLEFVYKEIRALASSISSNKSPLQKGIKQTYPLNLRIDYSKNNRQYFALKQLRGMNQALRESDPFD